MAARIENTVSLPAELLAEATLYAQQANMPLVDVIQEALRDYMELTPQFHARSRTFRQEAAALGLTPEEYSVRVVKEARAEKIAS